MRRSQIVGLAAVLVLFFSGMALGGYLGKDTKEELAERNRRLATADVVHPEELDNLRTAFTRIVFDFAKEREARKFIEESLGETENLLLDERKQIQTLVVANAVLKGTIEQVVPVGRDDNYIWAEIRSKEEFQDGSIETDGEVVITLPPVDENGYEEYAPKGFAHLNYYINMNPSVLVDRDENGLAECSISFGDMPITVEELICVNNLTVDLPVRSGFDIGSFATGGLVTGALVVLTALVVFN